MKVDKDLIEFLDSNEDLLNEDDFDELYKRAQQHMYGSGLQEMSQFFIEELQVYPWEYMTSIPSGAFKNCTLPTEVVMPLAKTIQERAFEGCKGVTKISMPAIAELGQHAFEECSNLKEVTFSENLEELPEYCLAQCPKLTLVKLPNSLRKLAGSVFGVPDEKSKVKIQMHSRKSLNLPSLEVSKYEQPWYKQHLEIIK